MKTAFLALLASLLLGTHASAANIQQGNWEVGGALNLSRGSGETLFYVSPSAQYFMVDRFSLGFDAGWATQTHGTSFYSFGPVVTSYFLVQEALAPFVSLTPIEWNRSGSLTYYTSTLKLGVKYFLTESVAVAPLLRFQRVHESDRIRAANSGALQVLFSIHL